MSMGWSPTSAYISSMEKRHQDFLNLAKRYVEEVRYFAKRFPTISRLLDGPNTHGLIALYVRTIQLYAHVLFVSVAR